MVKYFSESLIMTSSLFLRNYFICEVWKKLVFFTFVYVVSTSVKSSKILATDLVWKDCSS